MKEGKMKWVLLAMFVVGLMPVVAGWTMDEDCVKKDFCDKYGDAMFYCGRVYQLGRNDAIHERPMMSRTKREELGIWKEAENPRLVPVFHKCYEDGYLGYIRQPNEKQTYQLPTHRF
jgi:hypothetical protein